jgi:hypothetical protein
LSGADGMEDAEKKRIKLEQLIENMEPHKLDRALEILLIVSKQIV